MSAEDGECRGPSVGGPGADLARADKLATVRGYVLGRGGRTVGTKRTLLVEILGLPVAASAYSARPRDVVVAR